MRYLCDSCGHRGVDDSAATIEQAVCSECGEPVLDDPYDEPPDEVRPVDRPE